MVVVRVQVLWFICYLGSNDGIGLIILGKRLAEDEHRAERYSMQTFGEQRNIQKTQIHGLRYQTNDSLVDFDCYSPWVGKNCSLYDFTSLRRREGRLCSLRLESRVHHVWEFFAVRDTREMMTEKSGSSCMHNEPFSSWGKISVFLPWNENRWASL
jgi:hypothetical protein